jgi:hypothetical protein
MGCGLEMGVWLVGVVGGDGGVVGGDAGVADPKILMVMTERADSAIEGEVSGGFLLRHPSGRVMVCCCPLQAVSSRPFGTSSGCARTQDLSST